MVVVAVAMATLMAGCGAGDGGSTATAPGTTTGASAGGRTYRDVAGDVPAGQPDLTQVRVSNDDRTVHLAVRFATAPPLSANLRAGWTDMLLMGIDVPPIGPPPVPGGDWVGVDYALGMHGVDDRAVFRAMQPRFGSDGGTDMSPGVRALRSQVRGREITIELPRAMIGDPGYFHFTVAAAREGAGEGVGGTGDIIPATGTARYRLRPAAR